MLNFDPNSMLLDKRYLRSVWIFSLVSRAIVTFALGALFSDTFRTGCKGILPFLYDNALSHVFLIYLAIVILLSVVPTLWLLIRLRHGKKFDALNVFGLVLAISGLLLSVVPSLASAEFRAQLFTAIHFARQETFWRQHLFTVIVFVVFVTLWGPVLLLVTKRFSIRSKLYEAIFWASHRHETHIQKAVKRASGENTSPLTLKMIVAVINSYSLAASKLVEYGTSIPLMPGNFDVYAQCVKGILDFLSESDDVEGGFVFTLLKRPVSSWYNPLTAHIEEGNVSGDAVFTRPWWEDYKLRVAALKNSQKSGKLSMKRLILQRKIHNAVDRNVEAFYLLTDGNHKKHVDAVDLDNIPSFVVVPGGPDTRLLPEIDLMVRAHRDLWPDDAQLHLIGEYNGFEKGRRPSATKWTNLINHFQDAYHSKSVNAEKASTGNRLGIFYGYIKSVEPDFRGYARNFDDLFLVKVKRRGEDEFEQFGIAFIDDKTGDEVGIRFLDRAEIEKMVRAFEKQWQYEGTVDKFCFCEEAV